MTRRILIALLALAVCISGAALAEPIGERGTALNMAAISREAGYTEDADTGEWRYTPNALAAILDAVDGDAVRTYMSAGTLTVGISLSGNSRLGTVVPWIELYMFGNAEINANAASILTDDGLRYDFEIASEITATGKYRTELMTAPLNADGLDMLAHIVKRGAFGVQLHGDKRVYRFDIDAAETSNAHARLQGASVMAIGEALGQLSAVGGNADIDGAILNWERANGLKCRYVCAEVKPGVTATSEEAIEIDDEYGLLSIGDSSDGVIALHELLGEKGFLFAAAENRYTMYTARAVSRAQQRYGLVPTGSADAALISMLTNGAENSDEPADIDEQTVNTYEAGSTAEAGLTYRIDDQVEISIPDYRFAKAFAPTNGAMDQAISVGDDDDALIIFEGSVKSLKVEELDIGWDCSAALTVDGIYVYEAQLIAEQNNGTRFGSALLPLGEYRLYIYAEVPSEAILTHDSVKLTVSIGETELVYDVK